MPGLVVGLRTVSPLSAMHFNSVMNWIPQTFYFTFSSFPHLTTRIQKFTLQVEGRKKLARLRVESFFKMVLACISLPLHAIQNSAYEEKIGFGPSPTCRGCSCSFYLIIFVSSRFKRISTSEIKVPKNGRCNPLLCLFF